MLWKKEASGRPQTATPAENAPAHAVQLTDGADVAARSATRPRRRRLADRSGGTHDVRAGSEWTWPPAEVRDACHRGSRLQDLGTCRIFRKSIDDAIQNAITRASKTIRAMKWFEVVQTRGHIENGSVRHYQVTLRVGFTLEE